MQASLRAGDDSVNPGRHMEIGPPEPRDAAGAVRKRSVLGTALCVTTYDHLGSVCRHLARQERVVVLDFTNTQIVTLRRHDARFRAITRRIDYFVPDSMPLVWCLNARGARMPDRVYGPTFMRLFLATAGPDFTHYFLGGSEECAHRLQANLRQANPSLRVVGLRTGYFKPDSEEAIIEEVNRLSPDFIWVGLGTPKQQEWIERNRDRIGRGVLLAVGFAFDVNAGTKLDAPPWMQRLGLTWIFRMATEPRRLVGRYLKYNSLFLFYLLWDGLRGRAFEVTADRRP
jgi:N-acetylglucosaminyldiphosphoundecaprenol N-acetyl-beta-D-mannosaminyltransferase